MILVLISFILSCGISPYYLILGVDISDLFSRTSTFFEDGFSRIQDSLVVVVGLGGVGSHAAHMLARSGIGRLRLVDLDVVSSTRTRSRSQLQVRIAMVNSPFFLFMLHSSLGHSIIPQSPCGGNTGRCEQVQGRGDERPDKCHHPPFGLPYRGLQHHLRSLNQG